LPVLRVTERQASGRLVRPRLESRLTIQARIEVSDMSALGKIGKGALILASGALAAPAVAKVRDDRHVDDIARQQEQIRLVVDTAQLD
jgi:hypothetical protein